MEIVMFKGAISHPFFIQKILKIYLKMYCKIKYYYYLCINKHREQ